MAVPSALSPEPQTPDSPHITLVHSTLPLLEPRVSVWEQNCVCWPFRNAPVSLADFYLSLTDGIPFFHSQESSGLLFQTLVLWTAELSFPLRSQHLRGTVTAEMSFRNVSRGLCELGSLFHVSVLPTSLDVASSVNPWL